MTVAAATNYPTLSCMLMPLNGYDILVPKSIVREVVYKPVIESFDDNEDWLLGEVDWQDYVLPLISFEQMCNQPRASKINRTRAVICHTTDHTSLFPYFGIEVQSMPRPLILDSRALQQHDGMLSKHSEVVAFYVKIGSKVLAVPNFEKLELMIAARSE